MFVGVAHLISLLKNAFMDEPNPFQVLHLRSDFCKQMQFERAFPLFQQAVMISDVGVMLPAPAVVKMV